MSSHGLLNKERKSTAMNKFILLVIFIFSLLACAAESQGDQVIKDLMRQMDESEKKANEKASKELVAFMSLETMFPDPQVQALAKAAGKGNLRKIEELVKQGVDVNARGTSNATPLFWAMHNIKGFEKLLELGADPNVVFDDGGTVMHWAVQHKDDEFLKAALKHGGNPNLKAGSMGETPLFDAVGYETKKKADLLLDAGADINAQNNHGATPILGAATLGQFDLVYKMLNRGADYSIENKNGYDLARMIAFRRRTMDPNNELTQWMHKVIAWLNERGVEIPESWK